MPQRPKSDAEPRERSAVGASVDPKAPRQESGAAIAPEIADELARLRREIDGIDARILEQLAAECAPRLTLRFLEPASPEQMVDLSRGYDIGLSVEQGHVPNSALTLPNKATTYILAGVPAILTDIPGQRALAHDLASGAIVYAPGDVDRLSLRLAQFLDSPEAFRRGREAAWEAARRRWHWEHGDERGALLGLAERACA